MHPEKCLRNWCLIQPGAGDACSAQGRVNHSLHNNDIANSDSVDVCCASQYAEIHIYCQLYVRNRDRSIFIQVAWAHLRPCKPGHDSKQPHFHGEMTDIGIEPHTSSLAVFGWEVSPEKGIGSLVL